MRIGRPELRQHLVHIGVQRPLGHLVGHAAEAEEVHHAAGVEGADPLDCLFHELEQRQRPGVDAALCGILAGVLVPDFGWRSIFLVGAVLSVSRVANAEATTNDVVTSRVKHPDRSATGSGASWAGPGSGRW